MSKQQPTETTKKSKLTKIVEGFADLPLKDQISGHELITGILEQSLTVEKANLSQQRTDIETLLENIQK